MTERRRPLRGHAGTHFRPKKRVKGDNGRGVCHGDLPKPELARRDELESFGPNAREIKITF